MLFSFLLAQLVVTIFSIPALAGAAPGPFASYLFVFFYGEAQKGGESISFAVSSGKEPDRWEVLNNGRPILTSNVGTRGVRDPTIVRSHDGSKFWILATDLRMEGEKADWAKVSRVGSRSLVIWESTDLKHWSPPRMVQVSPPTAGNTWAPDAIWDDAKQAYLVSWSSSMYAGNDPEHKIPSHHQVMRSFTKDFVTFSKAESWIDKKSYSVIDTTVVKSGDTFHRFTKDERIKFIWQDTANSLDGEWRQVVAEIGKGPMARAEGPLVFPSITTPGKWHMFLDEFGGRGYMPLETGNISSGDWKPSRGYQLPKKAHHGYVIAITDQERQALLS